MREYDVLIVGGGIAGLATAWHLARASGSSPRSILLVEAAEGLGEESSGRAAGILRSFISEPVTAEVARRGAAFLTRPPTGFSPTPPLDPVGLLLAASGAAAAELRATRAGLAGTREMRELSRDAARALAPHVDLDAETYVFLPEEGSLDLDAVITGFADGTRTAGVEVRTATRVRELITRAGRVQGARLADGTRVLARTTVLAAGGWAGRLGRAAGSNVSLSPTRRHLAVSRPDTRIDPRWPVVWLEDAGFYCRPERGGLLVTACDETAVDPDHCERDPAVLAAIARKRALHTPEFARAEPAEYWCGMRTLTADERFVLGFDPDLGSLIWVAGLGGHGMTAGAELGRLASVLVRGEENDRDSSILEALAPGRNSLMSTIKG